MLLLTGIILLKLITPNFPLSILIKSSVLASLECFGLGLDKGAKYSQLPILNKIPTNGLNLFYQHYKFHIFLKNHNTLNLPLQLLFS